MVWRKIVHPDFGRYEAQLSWQISKGVPLKRYCPVCYWGSVGEGHRFCPYGHGEKTDISEYLYELTIGV